MMLGRWTPFCAAIAMLIAVDVSAAEAPKPTMDLEILANGQLLLRGELIDGMDDLEARLRIVREREPPFELSIKLPKSFSFESIASVMKVIQSMGLSLGLIGKPAEPAPIEPDGSTI